jgi:hypothetical protein
LDHGCRDLFRRVVDRVVRGPALGHSQPTGERRRGAATVVFALAATAYVYRLVTLDQLGTLFGLLP